MATEDTRSRIQVVALELFTEHGYDGTSLREISERLGVTKAALYYHFKSKEEILLSLFTDVQEKIGRLIEWAREQNDFSLEFRKDLLARLADLVYGDSRRVMRLLQENQPVLRSLKSEEHSREHAHQHGPGQWVVDMTELLTPPDASLRTRMRARMAFVSLVFGSFAPGMFVEQDASADELKTVGLELAEELLES
ncbi:TetR/AcrR family transcriptional regulator [Spelaeicoccus albus]|uniref:AcrR family transcriptional regulator n=1 Tax=Spelaeicoccus albus TaxID=1280376 RepID=A0A7Z0IJ17_9MICO|nr:TetR/AcrR family transcriptional regulator [Spelaeicoccus albus]NYI68947.1 AcrR family transcriptional regulator [Spelaeicoccus albus]